MLPISAYTTDADFEQKKTIFINNYLIKVAESYKMWPTQDRLLWRDFNEICLGHTLILERRRPILYRYRVELRIKSSRKYIQKTIRSAKINYTYR